MFLLLSQKFVAATPVPEDVVYITLGLSKYSIWKFALATFAGKFLIGELLILGATNYGKPILELFCLRVEIS